MLWDLLYSRWFQGVLAFFVLVVGGSLLYHWHVIRTTQSDMARHGRFLQGLEKPSETRPAEKVNDPTQNETSGLPNTPDETMDTPMPDETETELLDLTDAFLPEDFVSEEEAPTEEVPVSPYGFGPYPEIPADYPTDWIAGLPWFWSEERVAQVEERGKGGREKRGISFREKMIEQELLGRLSIQLWNEGRDFNGITTLDQTGLFYPDEPDVLYVKWGEVELSNGDVRRYIQQGIGSGFHNLSIAARRGREPLPDWIEIRSLNEGIDPYEYLELNR